MTFDLNLLQVLNAVLTENSVTRAADRLHVTPAAISNALARLRHHFGDPLFTKKGRGIVPTPRAMELAPLLAKHLGELKALTQRSVFHAAQTARTFSMAISDANQLAIVPPLIKLLTKRMPRAKLRVVSIDSLDLLGGLAGTDVDIVIGPDGGDDVISEPLFDQATVLAARRSHPVATTRALAREALENLGHVAVELAPGGRRQDMTAAAYARAGIKRRVVVVVPTFTAAAMIVSDSDFVATLPQSIYGALRSRLRLATVRSPLPALRVPVRMSWHERTHADPAVAAFRDLVRDSVPGIETLGEPTR